MVLWSQSNRTRASSGRTRGHFFQRTSATDAVITAPVLAAIMGDVRYGLGFAVVALAPLIAVAAVPVRTETSDSTWTPEPAR